MILCMDLEAWRIAKHLSFKELAEFVDLPDASTAQGYCTGGIAYDPSTLLRIVERTEAEVGAFEMWSRRRDHLRASGIRHEVTEIMFS